MPRGIAFDRFDIPQFRGETVRFPTLPADTTAARIVGDIGKIAGDVGERLGTAQQKAAALSESIKVDERFLQAAGEMDEQLANINLDPAAREKAASVYGEWEKSRLQVWGNGLTPEGNAALQKRLAERRLGAQHKSRMIEINDLGQRAEVNLIKSERAFVEDYALSRLDSPPFWQDTPALDDMTAAYGRAVAAGAKTKPEMEKAIAGAKKEAVAARVHAMMISGEDSDLNRLKTLFEMERQKPNSTWLGQIDTPTRLALEKQAKDADHTNWTRRRTENEDRRQARERQLGADQKKWAIEAEQKLDAGTLTLEAIREAESDGRIGDGNRSRYFRKALEDRNLDGVNDGPTRDRLANMVWSVKSDPAKVLDDVREARAAGKLNYATGKEFMAHLEGRLKAKDETGRTEQQTLLNKERGEVEDFIQILTTTKSPWEAFDPKANAFRLLLKERLALLPRDESAQVWWQKNKVHFVAQMSDQAKSVIKVQEGMMHVKPQLGAGEKAATIDSVVRNKASYEQRYGADARARMVEDIKRLENINMLREHMDLAKGDGKPGPEPSGSSAPAAKPSTKPAGGPLQSGSRAKSPQ